LRQLVEKTCDQLLKIPMAGDFDSLNVAQAGTVMLYEFRRKMDVL
jgi:23S rRNA (guanosine2251-2'-O)-methyltransferase